MNQAELGVERFGTARGLGRFHRTHPAVRIRLRNGGKAMSADLMLDLVRQGLVIALLSPDVIPTGSDDLRTIPVVARPTRVEYLAWSSFNPSPAAQAFLDSLPS